MSLCQEILCRILAEEKLEVRFPDLDRPLEELVEGRCCRTLSQIKAILEDETLSDPECFRQIEEIVTLFEGLGSGCGNRHDFG